MSQHDKHDPEGQDREAQRHPEGNATDATADPEMGVVIDDGVPAELENDKMIGESLLRGDNDLDEKNVNDQPGFMDGRLGGSDGEDREADPVEDDARGVSEGGVGARRSSGFDGGPPRK